MLPNGESLYPHFWCGLKNLFIFYVFWGGWASSWLINEVSDCLNTQSWKVILTFEIFLFANIRGNKVSDVPERRAKILGWQGRGPRNAHISTNTKRNDKVAFPGKAEICLQKSGPWALSHGYPKWRYGPYEALGRVWRPPNGAERIVIQVFVVFRTLIWPYLALFGLIDPYLGLFDPNKGQ